MVQILFYDDHSGNNGIFDTGVGANGEIYYKRNPSGNVGIAKTEGEKFTYSVRKAALFRHNIDTVVFTVNGSRVGGKKACPGVYFLKNRAGFEKTVFIR